MEQQQRKIPRNKELKSYLDYLIDQDYKERPVDIETFLSDDYYLGKTTNNGKSIYPYWMDALKKIFEDDSKILIVLTGAIGIGKSRAGIYAMAYCLYRLMCLRMPWEFFNLAAGGKMGVVFFNLTQSLGESKGFSVLQAHLIESPWFLQRKNALVRGLKEQYVDLPLFKYVLASPLSHGFATIGQDVIVGIMDELDSPTESAKQKIKVLQAYEQTVIRFKSRFVINGSSLGRLFLVSSKQDELSFIESFVAKMKKTNEVLVFDAPIWEVKPRHLFSGITFPVAIGDAYRASKIITHDEIEAYAKDGFKVIKVPVEFRGDFERDLTVSLRDIAGETVGGSRKHKLFASEQFITDCFDTSKQRPERVQTITAGLKDDIRWIMLLDVLKIRVDRAVPRYIHMDIGVTNDCMGLAMSCVSDWREMEVKQTDGTYKREKLPIIETDFVLRIQAREGDRIPIHKMRELVFDLKSLGFNIQKFTADLRMASEDTLQLFNHAGIVAEYFSVDKTITPYIDFRNLVYEKRWVCHPHPFLLFELKNLELSHDKQKIDHPIEVTEIEYLEDGDAKQVVMVGSKDIADACCGSVVNCLYDVKPPHTTKEIQEVFSNIQKMFEGQSSDIIKFVDKRGKEILGTKESVKMDVNNLKDFFDEIR